MKRRIRGAAVLLSGVVFVGIGNAAAQITGRPTKVIDVTTGEDTTCALLDNNGIKCWGDGDSGQTGTPIMGPYDYYDVGTRLGDMGDALPYVDVGPGMVTSLVAGEDHTCAVFQSGEARCWGDGGEGQLGNESDFDIGLDSEDMGANLMGVLAMGFIHTIAPHDDFTCVLLDAGCVKCFGEAKYGKLGDIFFVHDDLIGNTPGDMASLRCLDLGNDENEVIDISHGTGASHACALFDDGRVKCWGKNDNGQLGLGDRLYMTSSSGFGFFVRRMGDRLPYVDLGPVNAEGKVVEVAVGEDHSCARFESGCVKCWGQGTDGRLGTGATTNIGDEPGEMGSALECIDLGTNRSATQIAAGEKHTCAILDDGGVKCFGRNAEGQLGTDSILRSSAGQTGDALKYADIGPRGTTALSIAAGEAHTCVLTNEHKIKCWGSGLRGALGQENETNVGDGQTGSTLMSALPYINLWYEAEPEFPPGTIFGDPHFVGFDGSRFDYGGHPGDVFALISAPGLAVNALLGPDLVNGLTYMVAVAARVKDGPRVRISVGTSGLDVQVDDAQLDIDTLDVGVPKTFDGAVELLRQENGSVQLALPGIRCELSMRKGQFLDLTSVVLTETPAAGTHGVLGQTANLTRDGAGHGYEGSEGDYVVKGGLFDTDFKWSAYGNAVKPDLERASMPRKTMARYAGALAKGTAEVVDSALGMAMVMNEE